MKIIIDADGCPVVDLAIKIGKKFNLECIIMCDTSHLIRKDRVETIVLSKGADSVDFAIVNKAQKGDIIITQDYGLATMILSKGGYAINQNGLVYDDSNIDKLLFFRHVSKESRKVGNRTKGPKKRTKENDLDFEASFIRLIESKIN